MNLEQYLNPALYGVGEAKSWQSLIQEIESGDCEILIEGDRPVRKIEVLCLNVYDQEGESQLFEAYQEFSDGRRRERDLWGVSEKLKPGEDLESAAARALAEELGINEAVATVVDPSIEVEDKESPSYPGLLTRYVRRSATAYLPPHLVKPEYIEAQADKKTVFVWR